MASTDAHTILPRPTFDRPVKVLIVVSPYYADIAGGLLSGAKAELEAAGATYEVIEMPGALEIPTDIGISDRRSNFDGYVALGCVIRARPRIMRPCATTAAAPCNCWGCRGCASATAS